MVIKLLRYSSEKLRRSLLGGLEAVVDGYQAAESDKEVKIPKWGSAGLSQGEVGSKRLLHCLAHIQHKIAVSTRCVCVRAHNALLLFMIVFTSHVQILN